MTVLNQNLQDVTVLQKVMYLDIPTHRDAYSDRTAWLMSCFAELAYVRFDKTNLADEKTRERFREALEDVLEDTSKINRLNKVVGDFVADHTAEMVGLGENLDLLKYKIDTTFDRNGSQAILVRDDTDRRLVLAFRGTEPTKIKDIKADIDAKLESISGGGKSHRGFTKAYWEIGHDIQTRLSHPELRRYRLYITGHSLGGALASIAAKRLHHEGGISACYTFGSPRVGNKDWVEGIKTPMYRIVNASDTVTVLPPEGNAMYVFSLLVGLIPWLGSPSKKFLKQFIGYFHSGDMRYLGKSKAEDYSDTKLLPHVGFGSRFYLWAKAKVWAASVQDHSVTLYRRKLGAVAISRNPVIGPERPQ